MSIKLVGDGGPVKGGDEISLKMTIPSIPGIKKYTKTSITVDCPLIENENFDLK